MMTVTWQGSNFFQQSYDAGKVAYVALVFLSVDTMIDNACLSAKKEIESGADKEKNNTLAWLFAATNEGSLAHGIKKVKRYNWNHSPILEHRLHKYYD